MTKELKEDIKAVEHFIKDLNIVRENLSMYVESLGDNLEKLEGALKRVKKNIYNRKPKPANAKRGKNRQASNTGV